MRVIRALILTPIPAPHRVPLFNALAARAGLDLEVWYFAPSSRDHPWRDPAAAARFQQLTLRGLATVSLYQEMPLYVNPGLVTRLAARPFDVVVCGGYDHPSFWLALGMARLTRTRVLLWTESTLQDHRSGRGSIEAWKRRLTRSFDGYIVPGRTQLDYLQTLARAGAPVWISPNSVDAALFQGVAQDQEARRDARARLGLAHTDRVVLFVGRLLEAKGVGDLLAAAASLEGDARVRLVLVGTGPEEARFRAEASARGVDAHVLGFLQQAELAGVYAAADVFVLPTHSDPWGLVLNEAIAAGLPVVCSRAAGAAAQIVIEGQNGFLHDPGDVTALAQALTAALAPGQRETLGRASLALAASFPLERAVQAFEDALRGGSPSLTVVR
jgi:glycosyltransferase involved in cell wall biosynthesis